MQGLVAWVPILAPDGQAAAEAEAAAFDDGRVRHLWDGERSLAGAYAKTLGLSCPAWDVYLLYGRDARWDGPPPSPRFWMHQLPEKVGAHACRLLDPVQFANELRTLLLEDPGVVDDLALRLHSNGLAVVRADRSGSL